MDRVFIPMAEHFIGQAHAPFCATTVGIVDAGGEADAWYTVDPRGCPVSDYGIVAAKIGKEAKEPGMLDTFPAVLTETSSGVWTVTQPATDFLHLSAANETYSVFYWVQNFGKVKTVGDGVYVRMQLMSRHTTSLRPITQRLNSTKRAYLGLIGYRSNAAHLNSMLFQEKIMS